MNTVSSRSLARRSVLAATTLLSGSSLLLLAACGDNVAGAGAAPTTAAPSATTASTPASTTNPAPAAMSASPTADFAAACKPESLLAYVITQPNRPDGNYSSVKVYQCVSGYARLYAAPKQGMPSEAGQQFFLQYTGAPGPY